MPAATDVPVIAPPDATEAPASEPTDEPVATGTTAPVEEPTVAPTEPAQSVIPTEEPVSVAQAGAGLLDYEISNLQIGTSLPDLTLGPLQDEQWIVVTVDVKNSGTELATLDMANFKLKMGDGTELALDSATGAVATYLGMTTNNGINDTREIDPGERAEVVLVFVPPADATGLTLEAGDASLPLQAGASASGQTTASLSPSATEQTAAQMSTDLLTNTFEQFDILSPTATANAKTVPAFVNPWESSEE